MNTTSKAFLSRLDDLCEKRRQEILSAPDCAVITGQCYYVSNSGNDLLDGTTPETAWETLDRVSRADLLPGDGVLFCRGDLFRGFVTTRPGVTYAAYGSGEKPKFYGWNRSLADPALWELFDESHSIWKLREPILDCGTLVFNHGQAHSRKLIPSYLGGKFVCRDDAGKVFCMAEEMTRDLDIFWFYDQRLTTVPSKGEDFPIPKIDLQSFGTLYLRCDAGNPADIYGDIEAVPRRAMFYVKNNAHVTIDNLCMKYIGIHAIAAGGDNVIGLHVSNCEIGWIGGTIQHYFGTDPNYPQGRRGTVTRYGNGVEIYGGCTDYRVSNCYIYQVYDAGITHQITTGGKTYRLADIRYENNLVEYCVYAIEYFLEKTDGDTESRIENCEICNNILRFSGCGWGQQRHNTDTPALIKGWSYENTAHRFSIHHNIFDRSAYRMLHLVAKQPESCPEMVNNTYIQFRGNLLGQYGANEEREPEILPFDNHAADFVRYILGDTGAEIYTIDPL